jgi:Na+/H+-dicarboxylate symporter
MRVLLVLAVAVFAALVAHFLALGIENAVSGRDCARLFSGCMGYFLLAAPVAFVVTLGVGWWAARRGA